jgi:hypothetical protein
MSKMLSRSVLIGSIGLVETAAFGTLPTSTDPIAWAHAAEVSMNPVTDQVTVETLAGPASGGESARFVTLVRAAGTVRIPLSYEDIGAWLEWAMGKDVATSGSGPYTHVYAISPNVPHRSLVFVYQAADGTTLQDEYYGCQVEGLSISVDANGVGYATFTISAGVAVRSTVYQRAVASTETPAATALTTSVVLLGQHGGALSFNSDNREARSLVFEVSRTLDRAGSFGFTGPDEGVLAGPVIGRMTVTRVADEADSASLEAAHVAGTRATCSIVFTSGSKTFTFALSQANIISMERPMASGGAAIETIVFQAQSLSGSDYGAKLTVVNSQSSGVPTNGTWA